MMRINRVWPPAESSKWKQEITILTERLRSQELSLSNEIAKLKGDKTGLEAEVGNLRALFGDKCKDFNDLMSQNITLEAEIERYRCVGGPPVFLKGVMLSCCVWLWGTQEDFGG